MAKKNLKIQVTRTYEIEIDTENSIVKDYESEDELIDHIVSYNFSVLPVINNGVKVIDDELIAFKKVK